MLASEKAMDDHKTAVLQVLQRNEGHKLTVFSSLRNIVNKMKAQESLQNKYLRDEIKLLNDTLEEKNHKINKLEMVLDINKNKMEENGRQIEQMKGEIYSRAKELASYKEALVSILDLSKLI